MTRAAAWLVGLAACGGAAPATQTRSIDNATAPSHATTFAVPHAGMFELGRRWRYQVTDAGGTTEVACAVAASGPLDGGGAWGRITCEPADAISFVAGTWVEDARGLYWTDQQIVGTREPHLDDGDRFLDAAPQEGTHDVDLGEDAEAGETRTVSREGDAWCVETKIGSEMGSDDETLCFDRDGIVRGASASNSDDDPTEKRTSFARIE